MPKASLRQKARRERHEAKKHLQHAARTGDATNLNADDGMPERDHHHQRQPGKNADWGGAE